MRQIQEGGFQSRPYKSDFFFCVPCTAIRDNLRGVRKFSEGSPRRRGGRRVKSFLVKIHSELRELRVSAVKSLLPFGCGFAALGSLWLISPVPSVWLRLRRVGLHDVDNQTPRVWKSSPWAKRIRLSAKPSRRIQNCVPGIQLPPMSCRGLLFVVA